MAEIDVNELLTKNEDRTFDRTRGLGSKEERDAAGEKIAAFATSSGGTILFGQEDHKGIKGILCGEQEFITRLGDLEAHLDPKPTIDGPFFFPAEGKTIAVIRIASLGKGGPCCYRNTAYRRVMDRSEVIPPKELHRLWSATGQLHFEERPSNAPVDEIDRETLERYTQEPKKSGSFVESKFLVARKLASQLESGQSTLTNLGVIVLAKNPNEWLSGAKVHLIRFRGTTPGERMASTTLSLPLAKLIETCVAYIKTFQPTKESKEGIRRIEGPAIPEYVIREAIVNALAHRDYEHPGEILVRIFDNRLEISNPGAPTPEEWKEITAHWLPVHRNPLIYDFLRPVQLGEGAGQGLPEMKRLLAERGLPEPEFNQIQDTFIITIFNEQKKGGKQQAESELIAFIAEKKKISSTDAMKLLKISRPNAIRILNRLESKKYVIHMGSGRTSHYEYAESKDGNSKSG